MTTLRTTGKISTAIRELQEAFGRGTPIGGPDGPVYEGPRGRAYRRQPAARSGRSIAVQDIPRWR